MDTIGAIVGSLVAMTLFYLFADLLIRTPGYFIYCALFTKAEYDPDHQREVDIDSIKVAVTGIIFWVVVLLAGFAATEAVAKDRDLVAVPNAFNTQLYLDRSSVRREAPIVSFTYLLIDESQQRANAIDATIDCAARTYSLGRVESQPINESAPPTPSDPPASEKARRPIPARSTWEDLANQVCR